MQAFCSIHNVSYNCFEHHLFVTFRMTATHPTTVLTLPNEKFHDFRGIHNKAYADNRVARLPGTRSPRKVVFLRDELTRLREKDAEHDIERKRLMAIIEAKDQDIKNLTGQMGQPLTELPCLRKFLEEETHQLTNHNCAKFSTGQWP